MANAITTPIRLSARQGRQPGLAREARERRPHKHDRRIEAVMNLATAEVHALNEAKKAPTYGAKSVFYEQFPMWVMRLIDTKKCPDRKVRLRLARKVTKKLVSSRKLVLDTDTRGRVTIYAASYKEQQREIERQLSMAAHPSTGNVTTIRKGVAA